MIDTYIINNQQVNTLAVSAGRNKNYYKMELKGTFDFTISIEGGHVEVSGDRNGEVELACLLISHGIARYGIENLENAATTAKGEVKKKLKSSLQNFKKTQSTLNLMITDTVRVIAANKRAEIKEASSNVEPKPDQDEVAAKVEEGN